MLASIVVGPILAIVFGIHIALAVGLCVFIGILLGFRRASLWLKNFYFKLDEVQIEIRTGSANQRKVIIPYREIKNVEVHEGKMSKGYIGSSTLLGRPAYGASTGIYDV
jgi:membrane protein YdbS with pleckstrin-like domain